MLKIREGSRPTFLATSQQYNSNLHIKPHFDALLRRADIMDTSYLSSQVSTIIAQLHGLFDEIGVPSHERESRESEVSYT